GQRHREPERERAAQERRVAGERDDRARGVDPSAAPAPAALRIKGGDLGGLHGAEPGDEGGARLGLVKGADQRGGELFPAIHPNQEVPGAIGRGDVHLGFFSKAARCTVTSAAGALAARLAARSPAAAVIRPSDRPAATRARLMALALFAARSTALVEASPGRSAYASMTTDSSGARVRMSCAIIFACFSSSGVRLSLPGAKRPRFSTSTRSPDHETSDRAPGSGQPSSSLSPLIVSAAKGQSSCLSGMPS